MTPISVRTKFSNIKPIFILSSSLSTVTSLEFTSSNVVTDMSWHKIVPGLDIFEKENKNKTYLSPSR